MNLTTEQLTEISNSHIEYLKKFDDPNNPNIQQVIKQLKSHNDDPVFIHWALAFFEHERQKTKIQEMAAKHWGMQDQISELLGRGAETIKERDELKAVVSEKVPEWKSQLKWVVAIPEEPDSEAEYFPAESKEIAQSAVSRYRNMTTNRFAENPEIAETINNSIHYCLWHGTDEEFEALKAENFHDEAWFNEPMSNCHSVADLLEAFRDKDIVHCFHEGKELKTANYEEACKFYGVEHG